MKIWVQWIAMMMVLFTSWQAKSDTIKVDLNVPEPALRQDADGFVHLEVPGYMNIGRPGEPELPVGFLQVLIPPGQQVDSLELLPAEAVDLKSNRVVYPKQKPWPLSWGNRPHTPPLRTRCRTNRGCDPGHCQRTAPLPPRLRRVDLGAFCRAPATGGGVITSPHIR